ncbi:MAG: hypothetical protein HRT68_14335 [Flavobacteriaceae bacterium]|nr:hypothetical protein [Flavobacteriaceae bacterium]
MVEKIKEYIIPFLIIGIFLANSYYFLTQESILYLNIYIFDFRESILPISTITTIIFFSCIAYKRFKNEKTIRSKLILIFQVVVICVLFHSTFSDLLTTIGLKINRLTSNEIFTTKFIIISKVRDSENTVRGIIPSRDYKGTINELRIDPEDFKWISNDPSIDINIELEMTKGLLGIPYNPTVIK